MQHSFCYTFKCDIGFTRYVFFSCVATICVALMFAGWYLFAKYGH